jgi:hypothetical protein
MKRLQRYYLFVGIPVLCIVLGTIFFFDAIASTVKGNPHPQINYIIFGLIAAGCWQMTMHVVRINREAQHFYRYRKAVKAGVERQEIETLLESKKRPLDIELLMQLIEELRGKALNSVQHAAVEAELERYAARQQRRLMLSNFMSGMMVGMGLLGTFIGLLGALAEIGKLIGSFNLGAGMADPISAITQLVERLTSPMQAMGVAFSASLFGVLGSLIMGLLLVAVRSASSDLVALVQSGTSLMLDITDETEGSTHIQGLDPLANALGELAQHSPLLEALALALDQSERRVRDLTQSLTQLTAGIANSQASTQLLLSQMSEQNNRHEQIVNMVAQLKESMTGLAATQTSMAASSARMAELLQHQTDIAQHQANTQQALWQDQALLQKDLFTQNAQTIQTILDTEHQARTQQFSDLKAAQDAGLEIIARHLNTTEQMLGQHTSKFETMLSSLTQAQQASAQASESLKQVLSTSNHTLKTDSQGRTELVLHMNNVMSELKIRNEQIVQLLAKQTDTPVATAA